MVPPVLGQLTWHELAEAPQLVADAVRAVNPPGPAWVSPIDPELADTAAFCERYDVPLDRSANCVVVEGRRGETRVNAAVIVLAVDRADINKVVRQHLGVRKVSFAAMESAIALTGMEYGGITPLGLPGDWPVLIDSAVVEAGPVIIGSGIRASKIMIDGATLEQLPTATVLTLRQQSAAQ